jgi:hypothetical protein
MNTTTILDFSLKGTRKCNAIYRPFTCIRAITTMALCDSISAGRMRLTGLMAVSLLEFILFKNAEKRFTHLPGLLYLSRSVFRLQLVQELK